VICYDINFKSSTTVPRYTEVVGPILHTWVTVSIFGLLIAIGSKRRNGLWSQQERSQQQEFIANGSGDGVFSDAHGRGVPPPSAYILYQQPAQAELRGSAAASRPELAGAGSPNLNQQYYWTQHQQHSLFVQNQTQNAVSVPTPVEVDAQPYGGVPMGVAPGIPAGGSVARLSTQQQPQVTRVYEVAGTWDQKA
jgi:hypothetical protein